MLDMKFVLENPHLVKENLRKRFKADKIWMVDELVSDHAQRKKLQQELDDLRHQRNLLSEEVNQLKK